MIFEMPLTSCDGSVRIEFDNDKIDAHDRELVKAFVMQMMGHYPGFPDFLVGRRASDTAEGGDAK